VIFLGENATSTTVAEPSEQELEKEVKKASEQNRRYIRPSELVAFLLTTFGQKNLDQFVNAYRQFFMISFLGISGRAYGLIVFIESIYDAVDDSLSGLIIDRTRTRWGRLRPYMIITVPIWGLATLMLFTTPQFLSGNTSKIVWAVIAIFAYNLGMSYFNAWQILLYNITPSLRERDNLIATSKFFELFGTWIPAFVPIFVSFMPKISKSIGMQDVYSGFAVAMMVIAGGTAIYGFFAMRERVPLASREQMQEISVLDSFKNAVKNKPMFILMLANFFNGFKSVGASTESFFWLHNTGSLANGTIAGLFTGIPNFIITPITPKLIHKFGARNTAIGAGIFGGIAYTLMFIIGYAPFGQGKINALYDDPVLMYIADRYHKTVRQVVLRFQIQLGVVVIPKTMHSNRLKENFEVFDFGLEANEMEILRSFDKATPLIGNPQDPVTVASSIEW